MGSKLAFEAAFLLGGTFLTSAASAQCPTVGNDTGCGSLITVTGTGATVTQTGMGPYDGSDDTLIGVMNNIPACVPGQKSQTACGISIYSLDLTSTINIFGFDGDGISSSTYGVPGNAMDSTQYGGPNAYFTNYSSGTSGRVNFITPIAPGATGYFSLENVLNAGTACSTILNNSLKGATGAGFTPAPVGNAPNSVNTVQIRATFVPQGNDPTTGMPYTLAAAAQVCGFLDFNWQQTITNDVTGIDANCAPTPLKAPPSYNDPPTCGYVGMAAYLSPLQTYWDSSPADTTDFALSKYKTANQLSFYDAPNDPMLPAGQTMNFTTQLVGLQGPNIASAAVVPTGILFTWTSNHKGAAGGTKVTLGDPTAPVDTSGTGGTAITSVSQTATYNGVGVSAINGSNNTLAPTNLLAAVLPESRSAQPNGTVTAFATLINTGTTTASSCSIVPANSLPTTFAYQTTNSATNALTGTANTPVDIPGNNGSQSFVISFTPTAAVAPTDVGFNSSCTNSTPAPIVSGLNTLLLSASTSPTADVVALGATIQNDGIVHVTGSPGTGAFAVASVNLGAGGPITVAANTGAATLPLTIQLCQTNPTTGQCTSTIGSSVATTITTNATPTFGIFVTSNGAVPLDPANNRVFVTFTDSTNAVRGKTSVAVATQ